MQASMAAENAALAPGPRAKGLMIGNLVEQQFLSARNWPFGAALSMGSTGFVVPNDIIEATGETRVLDGVEIEFQLTPGTAAPGVPRTGWGRP